MSVSSNSGGGSRTRIETLRLRVPATDACAAKSFAMAVASKLALSAGDLTSAAGQKTIRARVNAASISQPALADSIVDQITGRKRGGR
jgi:hypothetical protein